MDRFLRFLSSYKASIILMLVYAIGLAMATFIEKQIGTTAAKMLVYYSPLFLFLQFLLVVNFILIVLHGQFFKTRKWAMLVIHFSIVVILGGALITFLFGKEGQVHIREGEKTNQMVMHTSKGVKKETLPFYLELVDFRLVRYPGSKSPSSYESDLRVYMGDNIREASVFMNNVLDVKGYRFFQASYDPDEKGTILSVNRDVVGKTVTYSGYFCLAVGFLLMFFMPNSRFRRLVRQLSDVRKEMAVVILLPLAFIPTVKAAPVTTDSVPSSNEAVMNVVQKYSIPEKHVSQFSALPIQFKGRIMPMNTFSSEILRKVHKEQSFGNLDSDRFLLSLLVMPQLWMNVPLIAVPQKGMSIAYHLPEEYVAYSSLFDLQGNYKLLPYLQEIYHRPAEQRNSDEKELIKLDERVNILYQLWNHTMPAIFPDARHPNHTWYAADFSIPSGDDELSGETKSEVIMVPDSMLIRQLYDNYLSEVRLAFENGDWQSADDALDAIKNYQDANDKAELIRKDKIEAELLYNRLNIFDRVKVGYFIMGGLLLVIAVMQLINDSLWKRRVAMTLTVVVGLLFVAHMGGMGLRWYISGYAPWSNSYETMVYVSWATVLAGLIFGRKSYLTRALAILFAGVILFVAALNWMDPQINTLIPVLKSPWLMFHVAVIVAAYGFFGISFLLGIANLSIMVFYGKRQGFSLRLKELTIINNLSLLTGLALMTVGTFLGAIWANESWGRYWGWDPKETWALITVVIYTVVTHIYLLKQGNSLWLLNLLSVFAFSSVLMTFLGVNYLLSGMHSYGQTEGIASVFIYIASPFVILALLGLLSFKNKEHCKDN